MAYESVPESVSAVQYALPGPTPNLERLVGTDLEPLSDVDPQRVLYNALVPFISELLDTAVAVVDAFVDHLESEEPMRIRDRA